MTANAPQSSGLLTNVLHRDWEKAIAWAEENGLTDELLRAIATCRIRDKPNLFGSFLAQITSPKSFMLLEQWRLTEPSAGDLFDLAVACCLLGSDYPVCVSLTTLSDMAYFPYWATQYSEIYWVVLSAQYG
ncbi:MAG: hypothetical protein HZC43_04165 [Nitrosomonadales bacterium]|nr:hypothetical protein [Nitrosomonadales bacterium]